MECVWIEITRPNAKNIVIGTIYRPPSGNVSSFCDKLIEITNDVNIHNNKHIILICDFNINYMDKTSDDMKQLHQFELFTNFKQLIDQPTRLGNILDLIYTNSTDISQQGVHDIGISDHELIYCCIKKEKTRYNRVEYIGRSYKNYDPNIVTNYLQDYDCSTYFHILDPNECWIYVYNVISDKLNELCPIKKKYVRDRNEPWLTNDIIDLIYTKNSAWKRAKKTNDPDDIKEAKILRNRVKDVIRGAKASFVQDYLYNDHVSVKKFWEKINYVMPTKEKQAKINLLDQETLEPVNDRNLSYYINNFFAGIGPKLAQQFTKCWVDDLDIDPPNIMSLLK